MRLSTVRTGSTSWLTTAASARVIALTIARSRYDGSISSITTSDRSAKRRSPANSESESENARRREHGRRLSGGKSVMDFRFCILDCGFPALANVDLWQSQLSDQRSAIQR